MVYSTLVTLRRKRYQGRSPWLVGLQSSRNCNIDDGGLHIGALLYRAGADPMRDIVAFCGPGNAGYGNLFHSWIELDDHILDFSVGDWRSVAASGTEITFGTQPLPPVQWTERLPNYWCRPRTELTGPWRADGTPAPGEAWYGPFNGDPFAMQAMVSELIEDAAPLIAEAVEKVMAKAAAQMGSSRPGRGHGPGRINPIIETGELPTSAPAGMIEMMLSEIFELAGISLGDVPDAVAYVSQRPTTREQARQLLSNMAIAAGR